MPDQILLEDGNGLIHEGGGDVLLEGEDSSLVIPVRTHLGLQVGDEVVTLGLKIGSETLDGVSA